MTALHNVSPLDLFIDLLFNAISYRSQSSFVITDYSGTSKKATGADTFVQLLLHVSVSTFFNNLSLQI